MATGEKYDTRGMVDIFFIECRELLEAMESSLLKLEKESIDEESIRSIFRAAHTIKGSSGMFGFGEIEMFTHTVENLLDDVSNDKINLNHDMIALLLECHDFILLLVDFFEEQNDGFIDDDTKTKRESLQSRLKSYMEGSAESTQPEPQAGDSPVEDGPTVDREEEQEGEDVNQITVIAPGPGETNVRNECWHISLRFKEETFNDGFDPQSFISYLNELGEIAKIKTISESIPAAAEMDPHKCYIGFEIDFKGNTTKDQLEDVFEFVQDDCVIRILMPYSDITEYVKLIQELPDTPQIGKILTEIGSLTEVELAEVLKLQETEKGKLFGEIVVEENMVPQPVLDAAVERQKNIRKAEEWKKKSIRIDPEKLDNLINLVGELVINGANVKQLSDLGNDNDLSESVSRMSRLIEEIRDSTMNIRMVQIGETFGRFERIVRDLSKQVGKKIDLVVNGGETELDKTLIEKISDPLMHLVRNSIDHGIDTPEERQKKGKPVQAKIYLNAYHETGSIVVEIIDDGNGINKEKIIARAIERGLLQTKQVQHLSEEEIFRFIFEPGFSTAEEITSLSGRGVGMDVVKKNIEGLRGSVAIESTEGEGTTVRIHLPLTLAIIDGFMVEVGDAVYVIPLDMVIECTEISLDEIKGQESGNFVNLRGDVLPFLHLRELFDESGTIPKRENIIVVEYAHKKAGIVVDKLIGEFQTVIKPLGKLFNRIQWISGATILGTGDVALILDVPMLIQHIRGLENKKAG
ncbi:MAG: chemotaxis protein CheA [bacterium]|nr:chemotaxis protein CheA [bacterium]